MAGRKLDAARGGCRTPLDGDRFYRRARSDERFAENIDSHSHSSWIKIEHFETVEEATAWLSAVN